MVNKDFKMLTPHTFSIISTVFLSIILALKQFVLSIVYYELFAFVENEANALSSDYMFIAVATICFIFICSVIQIYFIRKKNKIIQKIKDNLEINENNKIYYKNLIDIEKMGQGNWLTKVSSDIQILSNCYFDIFIAALSGIIQFISALIYGFFISFKLTLIILLMSLISLILSKLLTKQLESLQQKKQEANEKMYNFVLSLIRGLKVIHLYRAGKFMFCKLCEYNDSYVKASLNIKKKEAAHDSISIGVGFIVNTIWMIIALYMVKNGELLIGGFLGFMNLSSYYNWPFFRLSGIINKFNIAKTSYMRMYQKENNTIHHNPINQFLHHVDNGMVLHNITFKYPNSSKNVLDQFNLSINKGERILLMGRSGIGKTTLINIMMSLYSPKQGMVGIFDNGEVYLGNDVVEKIAYVPQQSMLFSATIKENISMGNVDCTDEDIINAAIKANAHEFIMSFSNGYNTKIGKKGVELSGGQKQRIALARAYTKQADYFILDEVTSAMDTSTEKVVMENLYNDNKTIIMIIHRQYLKKMNGRIIELS